MNDKEKLINTLRSEASRLGYYGLAIEDFIKKSINDIVLMQKNGVEKILSYGSLSEFEQATLNDALETLKSDIKIGEEFID